MTSFGGITDSPLYSFFSGSAASGVAADLAFLEAGRQFYGHQSQIQQSVDQGLISALSHSGLEYRVNGNGSVTITGAGSSGLSSSQAQQYVTSALHGSNSLSSSDIIVTASKQSIPSSTNVNLFHAFSTDYDVFDNTNGQSQSVHLLDITQDWGKPQYVIDPITHLPVKSATGKDLQWPSGINPIDIYNDGVAYHNTGVLVTASSLAAGLLLFRQNGYYDFQRSGGVKHAEFVDASTVGIGLFYGAAGVPISQILTAQNAYAERNSRYPPGTQFDDVYKSLPIRNVQNTMIGYELAKHIYEHNRT